MTGKGASTDFGAAQSTAAPANGAQAFSGQGSPSNGSSSTGAGGGTVVRSGSGRGSHHGHERGRVRELDVRHVQRAAGAGWCRADRAAGTGTAGRILSDLLIY